MFETSFLCKMKYKKLINDLYYSEFRIEKKLKIKFQWSINLSLLLTPYTNKIE